MEQLVRAVVVLCCGASSVYNTDEDGHSNGVTSASIQAARTAVLGAPAAEIRVLWHPGTPNPKFSHLYPSLPRRLEVLIYAQIYVLRALDGEIFFASAGPLAAGLARDFCRCRLEVLHLFENFTPEPHTFALYLGESVPARCACVFV